MSKHVRGQVNRQPNSRSSSVAHATWLDRLPHPEVADSAAACLEQLFGPAVAAELVDRADGDRRFALWLHLADYQLDLLPPPAASPSLSWRAAYDAGWSPRNAALAAWADAGAASSRPKTAEATRAVRPEVPA